MDELVKQMEETTVKTSYEQLVDAVQEYKGVANACKRYAEMLRWIECWDGYEEIYKKILAFTSKVERIGGEYPGAEDDVLHIDASILAAINTK